jgi:hypothetical protein
VSRRLRVEPARLEQIRLAYDGRLVLLDAEAGSVAAELQAIDPCLKVAFADNAQPCFIVYWQSTDGREQYLVHSAQAHLNRSGVYEGLDERIVERIREIDPQGRSGYDYAQALERGARRREKLLADKRHEMLEPLGEIAADAIRKDLGARYKSRAFIPRDIER